MIIDPVEVFDVLDRTGINVPRSKRSNIVWISRHDLTPDQVMALSYVHGGSLRVEKQPIIFSSLPKMLEIVRYFSEDGSFVYLVPPRHYLEELQRDSFLLGPLRFRRFKGRVSHLGEVFSIVEYCRGAAGLEEKLEMASSKLAKIKKRSDKII